MSTLARIQELANNSEMENSQNKIQTKISKLQQEILMCDNSFLPSICERCSSTAEAGVAGIS